MNIVQILLLMTQSINNDDIIEVIAPACYLINELMTPEDQKIVSIEFYRNKIVTKVGTDLVDLD